MLDTGITSHDYHMIRHRETSTGLNTTPVVGQISSLELLQEQSLMSTRQDAFFTFFSVLTKEISRKNSKVGLLHLTKESLKRPLR